MQFNADAAKIKRWREERHWSQEHLAELAGIGLRTVQRIENGETASQDSLKALAAAFNVDVMALSVDPRVKAAEALQREQARKVAALRLSFWIHLASYLMGMVIFAGISIGMGSASVMLWPAIWWTVGLSGHAVTVVIVELVFRHEQQYGLSPRRS
jgi:transcriptional regulator with XRE-family HTH domain